MTERPLRRRRRLMAGLDEDHDPAWPSHELARLEQTAKERQAQRDRRLIEEGENILAEYMTGGRTPREALDGFAADLFEESA